MTDEPRFIAGPGVNAWQGTVHWAPARSLWVSAMLLLGFAGAVVTFSVENLMVFLVTTAVTLCCGHSLGMHRLLIHRSWQTFKPIEYLFVWFGVLVGLAGPTGMMRTHDLRDWAQRQPRCHDYFAHRQVWYRDLWWQLHCDLRLSHPPRFDPEAGFRADPIYAFMERHWMAQQLPVALLLAWLGGWQWVIWGVALRVGVSVLGHWLIGFFAHRSGRRRWHVEGAGVQGYNIAFGGPLSGLMTMGECWHNNHHAFPGSARLGLDPGQVDPGWWLLKAMERFGLAWAIHLPQDLPPRPQLVNVGAGGVGEIKERNGDFKEIVEPRHPVSG